MNSNAWFRNVWAFAQNNWIAVAIAVVLYFFFVAPWPFSSTRAPDMTPKGGPQQTVLPPAPTPTPSTPAAPKVRVYTPAEIAAFAAEATRTFGSQAPGGLAVTPEGGAPCPGGVVVKSKSTVDGGMFIRWRCPK